MYSMYSSWDHSSLSGCEGHPEESGAQQLKANSCEVRRGDGGTLKKGAALNPKKGEWLGFMVDDVDDVDVLSRIGCQIHLGEN